ILIYSGETIYTDLFHELKYETELYAELKHDLRQIYSLWGERLFTDEAKEAIRAWAKAGGEPSPDHPKLIGYNARRAAHLLKLCLISSVSCTDEPVITLDNFVEALDWLVQAEAF